MWHKSTRSNENGNCVEVAFVDSTIAVRDSKHPDGPILRFPRLAWATFIERAKDGEFDL